MPMGYEAFSETVVTNPDDLKQLNLKTYNALLNIMEEYELTLDDLARIVVFYEGDEHLTEEQSKKLEDSYEAFLEEFYKETGVYIELGYHSSDLDGDCYDDVDGAFFKLTEVYQLTEAARKLKEKVNFQDVFYVHYG